MKFMDLFKNNQQIILFIVMVGLFGVEKGSQIFYNVNPIETEKAEEAEKEALKTLVKEAVKEEAITLKADLVVEIKASEVRIKEENRMESLRDHIDVIASSFADIRTGAEADKQWSEFEKDGWTGKINSIKKIMANPKAAEELKDKLYSEDVFKSCRTFASSA